jgi:DNA-binding winged helix-turn-helix (wHTH) protein/TolB-like protein
MSKELTSTPNPRRGSDLYEFCSFRFDPDNRVLQRAGGPISLTPKALEVLLVLVQNGSQLTTKEELMSRVWGDSFVEDANLTVTISALRRQLGDAPEGQQYIETVQRSGYRFGVPVQLTSSGPRVADEHLPLTVQAGPQAAAVDTSLSPTTLTPINASREPHSIRTRGWIISVIAAVLLLLLAATYMHRSRSRSDQISPHVRRLAILPFQNLQENEASDFLGFSLADAIITKLGYVQSLTVRPSYSVRKYRGQAGDIAKIASELNVDTLLTGTFLHQGDDLRIACQLVEVKTESILWKGAFDLKYDNLLTVQDRVAQEVIRGLEITLSASETQRLKMDEAVSPLAYEYYLRGVDDYSRGEFLMAVKMLERATELAPRHALSWANLGKSYSAIASFQSGGIEQYRKAEAALEQALRLQPDGIDSHIYMANLLTDTGRVERAVPLLREALRTNSNNAETHWELGYAYRFAGLLPESITECEQARKLDPVVKLNSSAMNGYLYTGQYDRFLESLPKGSNAALIVFYRGLGEYYKHDWQQAEEDFNHAFELDRTVLQAQIGHTIALGMRHQQSEAVTELEALERRIDEHGTVDPEALYKVAQAHAILGSKQAALRVLKQSIANGFFPYPYLQNDPLLDPIRGEAGFAQLLNSARQRHEAFKSRFGKD